MVLAVATLLPVLKRVLQRFAHIRRLVLVADRGLLSLDNLKALEALALPDGALQPAYAGIRPKLSGPGEPAAGRLGQGRGGRAGGVVEQPFVGEGTGRGGNEDVHLSSPNMARKRPTASLRRDFTVPKGRRKDWAMSPCERSS